MFAKIPYFNFVLCSDGSFEYDIFQLPDFRFENTYLFCVIFFKLRVVLEKISSNLVCKFNPIISCEFILFQFMSKMIDFTFLCFKLVSKLLFFFHQIFYFCYFPLNEISHLFFKISVFIVLLVLKSN